MIKVEKQYFLMAVIFHRWWFWGFLVAQTMKNLSVMWETWVRSLGWGDPLEEGMATHSSILAWRIPTDRGAWGATAHGGHKESDTTEWLSTHTKVLRVPCSWSSSSKNVLEMQILRSHSRLTKSERGEGGGRDSLGNIKDFGFYS